MSSTADSDRWVSDRNYSSISSILSWIVGITVFLCVIAKIATKFAMQNRLGADDITIVVSLAFSIGMVASVSVAAANGLGRYGDDLNEVQIQKFEKNIYATDLIYTFSLLFSKISMLFIIRFLTPKQHHVMLLWTLGGLLGLWALSSIFAAAFQCPWPNTWTILNHQCFDQKAFWVYYCAMNVFTEICLIFAAISLITGTQLRQKAKMTVLFIFGLRAVVIGAIVAELIFRLRVSSTDNYATMTLWPVQLCRQFVQSFSIIFACTPFMKPFFGSLSHGQPRYDKEQVLTGPKHSRTNRRSRVPVLGTVGNWLLSRSGHSEQQTNPIPSQVSAERPGSLQAPGRQGTFN